MTSRRHFLFLKITFPGRPIFIQLPPGDAAYHARGQGLAQEASRTVRLGLRPRQELLAASGL